MAKQIVGRIVKAPKGWTFKDGILSPEGDFNPTTFDALYAWAKDRKYGLEPTDREYVKDGQYIHCYYKVWADSWDITEKFLGNGKWRARPTSRELSLGQVLETLPSGPYWNACANCGRAGLRTWRIKERRMCAFCAGPCSTEGCTEALSLTMRNGGAEGNDKCLKCVPRERCNFCTLWFPVANIHDIPQKKHKACDACWSERLCGKCGKFALQTRKLSSGKRVCTNCYGEELDKEREPHETFDVHELPISGSLQLENLPNRPVRVISIETEVDGDPIALANTLYNCGLVREAFVENYGSPCPDNSHWPAFLKYDGSVTGGELINYLLQLDKPEHADSLRNVLAKLRSLHKLGKVEYNPNCGGHIHIDAQNFSSDNVWRLVTGYNYLEDVIFRLAGSGHKFGHRTLVPGHDRANNGRGYSHPTAKGPWGVRSGAFKAMAQQDRMTGLNFQPYFGAVNYCSCGAGAEKLRSCTCTLPKCTIEWRVWNTQAHPRILHGWIAFMQALHAWADTPKEMTIDEEKEYAPFAWTKQPWSKTSSAHKETAIERVRWIFSNLVFSTTEKDSLAFAFQQTDMKFPDGFWKEIAELPTPKNRNVKAPRNCFARVEAIKTTPPETRAYGDVRHDPNYQAIRAIARPRRRAPRFNNIIANDRRFP